MQFSRGFFVLHIVVYAALVCCLGCKSHNDSSESVQAVRDSTQIAVTPHPPPLSPEPVKAPTEAQPEPTEDPCAARIQKVLAGPKAPGAPEFEKHRVAILSGVKAEPLVFTDTPQYQDDPEEPPRLVVQGYRTLLDRSEHPWDALERMLPHFRQFPQHGRQTVLRDGYLFADNEALANALVNKIRAEHLFRYDNISVQRGSRVHQAQLKRGRYYFTDGPNKGEQVRLLLFDRLWAESPPKSNLALDFRELRSRLHFSETQIVHLGREEVVVKLLYGEHWATTLLKADNARLSVQCTTSTGDESEREAARDRNRRRTEALIPLRQAMLDSILDQLPFDEPRNEFGFQLDGILRKNWVGAYMTGKKSFAFNGDRYRVFGPGGRPLVPEVCVDFLTDTLERASGTWWANKGQPRKRLNGGFSLDHLDFVQRAELRRVPDFISYTESHPEQFKVAHIPEQEQIELGKAREFERYLLEQRQRFQPGDIMVIRGYTPWDPHEQHYHSFFIYETDPLTGLPFALVGNAGRPSVRVWETEARRTPKRSLRHHVHIRTEWLESIRSAPIPQTPPPPAPLSPPGNAG